MLQATLLALSSERAKAWLTPGHRKALSYPSLLFMVNHLLPGSIGTMDIQKASKKECCPSMACGQRVVEPCPYADAGAPGMWNSSHTYYPIGLHAASNISFEGLRADLLLPHHHTGVVPLQCMFYL